MISDVSLKIAEYCKTRFISCKEETRGLNKLRVDLKEHRSVKGNTTTKILMKGKPSPEFYSVLLVGCFSNSNDV